MSVRSEKSGPVTTVVLSRPERRNAVDRDTADALVAAFEAFDRDESAQRRGAVGRGRDVLRGGRPGGRVRGARRTASSRAARAPWARRAWRCPSRCIAAVAGHAVAGRARARALVRSARRRGGRDVRRLLPPLGRAAHRRRHGAPAAAGRGVARARHDPHRPRRAGAARRSSGAWPTASSPQRPRARGGRGAGRRRSRRSRSAACARTAAARSSSGALPLDAAIAHELELGVATIASGETVEGATRFARGAGRHGATRACPRIAGP